MDVNSRSACRERALFWALHADESAAEIVRVRAELGLAGDRYSDADRWATPAGEAVVAQVWAMLALSATDP